MFGKKSRSFLLLKSRMKQNSYTLYCRANRVETSMGKSRSTIIPIMTKWHEDSEYSDLELTSGKNQSNQNHSFPGFLVKFPWQFINLNIYNKYKLLITMYVSLTRTTMSYRTQLFLKTIHVVYIFLRKVR